MTRLSASAVPVSDRSRLPRFPALRRPYVGLLALLAAALLVAGCAEDVQGPERGGLASLSLRASVEPAGDTAAQQQGEGLESAFRQADVVTVRVLRRSNGSVLAEVERAFEPGEGTTELQVEVELDADRVPATVELELRRGEDPLFRGAADLALEAGDTETVELGLTPVPAELEVPSGPVTFDALGARRQLSATARFATGDPIPGADIQWSGSDASVAEVLPDGEAIARGPGEAEATATLDGLSGTVTLVVDPAAASVTVTPSSAELGSLGATRDFSASVVDANGNPVPDAQVSWSSTDASVVRVDATGRATANGAGTAGVVASTMGVQGQAQVTVSLGPTGRLTGRVTEVQVDGSASAAAAVAGASALPTGPLGGVTVEFLQGGQVVSQTTTASDGSWTSPSLPVGVYDIRYVRDGFVSVTLFDAEVTEGTTGSVLEVPLVPGSDEPGTATGRIVSASSGSGVGGAAVALREGLNRPNGEVVASAETDPDGSWRIEGAPAGTYTLTSSAPGFLPGSTVGAVVGGEELGGQDLALEGNEPPTVTIESPADGDRFAADPTSGTAEVTLEASGEDPDGTLGDDAFGWTSSVDGDLGTGRTLTVELSEGDHTLTVTVTDEAGSTASASVTVTVFENQPPSVTILRPEPGRIFSVNPQTGTATVEVEGMGEDPEDGQLTGQSLIWRDGPRDLGFGQQLTVQLPPGDRTILLIGTDSQGATGQASVGVTVLFADGFESSGWSETSLWNRSTLSGIQNQAFVDGLVNLAPNDDSNGLLPPPDQGSFASWYGEPVSGQPTTGNYMKEKASGQEDGSGTGGHSAEPHSGTLTSPPFSVPEPPSGQRVVLRFRTWFEIESVNPGSFDLMKVRVDDGNTVQTLGVLNPTSSCIETGGPAIPFGSGGGCNGAPRWVSRTVDMSAFHGEEVRIVLEFDTGDTLYNGFRGWIVDDVRLELVSSQTSKAGVSAAAEGLNPVPDPEERERSKD